MTTLTEVQVDVEGARAWLLVELDKLVSLLSESNDYKNTEKWIKEFEDQRTNLEYTVKVVTKTHDDGMKAVKIFKKTKKAKLETDKKLQERFNKFTTTVNAFHSELSSVNSMLKSKLT